MRLLRSFVVYTILICASGLLNAQPCMPTPNNGSIINLACNQTCIPLNFSLPHLKATGDYILRNIPYNPNPYLSPTGIEDPAIYQDDEYGFLSAIPFPFCFYDDVYNSCVVGSNGLITFDRANASCNNAYPIPFPIPYAGGTICQISPAYYPRASIMAAYSDLDPRTAASPADRRVMWFSTGTAPFRKFIISFYHIGVFGNTCGLFNPNTFQIVLNEATGLSEIFFEQKTCFASGPNGVNAILGIQNWNRDKAVAAPGKNATAWSENNTGYQFIPSSGASRFISSQLFTLAGVFVANADTATTQPGMIDINFLNVCPPPGNNSYVLRTTFANCDGGPQIMYCDTIQINRTNSLNATATSTPAACGPPSGTITATVPPGIGTPPYTFVLDGAVTQTGAGPMVFNNVAAGNHSVVVTDASGGCTSTINITVANNSTIFANITSAGTSCAGVNNGSITVTPANGNAPYTFQLDGGPLLPGPVPFTFNNVSAGSHTVVVRDNSGCVSNLLNVFIATGIGVTASASATATSCNGANNGSITVTTTTGQALFQFSINGGPQQPGNIFTNLASGTYNIVITDAAGCSNTLVQTILAGPAITASAAVNNVLCYGGNNGSVTVSNITPGTAPFQYSLDGINWQASPVFNGMVAGAYTIYFQEANGCQNSMPVTITEPAALVTGNTTIAVVCNGQNNGIINISASGGTGPYQYSLNGAIFQNSNSFNVPAGNYTVTIRDANGCTSAQNNITVTEPALLIANAASANATCNGGNDGVITAAAVGGNLNYQYSIDGINFQASDIFNVAPGTYTVTVRDNLNCIATRANIVVGLTSNLTHTSMIDPVICEGSSTQINFISNATNYTWSPSVGISNTQSANTVANPATTQQYIVSYTLGRCTEEDTVVVNVNAAPVPDAGPDGYICYGQSYSLQGSGGIRYNWTPSNYLSSTTVANPLVTPNNTMTYTLSILADANNCPSLITDQVKVDVTPPIKVKTYPGDTIVYAGDQFRLLATSIATGYLWTPSFDLDNPSIPNPVLTVTGDVIITVTASTQAGCKGEAYVRVQVYKGPDLYVPTGFTPNGDGLNDKFKPFPVGIKELKYFRIYNRWGQMIFSTNRLNDGWDGKIAGIAQASGTFVWMAQGITKDGKLVTKKGVVTLIR